MMGPGGRAHDDARLMAWENFRASFLDDGLAADVPLAGDPPVTIYAEAGATAIGLRTAFLGAAAPESMIEAVEVGVAGNELRVFTRDRDLFQPVFAFLLDVGNRIQLDNQAPGVAFASALASWRRMLASASVLSDEFQLGLAGELWVLDRLIRTTGPSAVEAWTGADRDAHDFRLTDAELEVKATGGEHRRHVINRLDQLEPSPSLALHLLSIQLSSAGLADGWSLGDQVDAIRAVLRDQAAPAELFEERLQLWGWRDSDRAHYPKRRRLRTKARMTLVDDAFPRLTPATLGKALGPLAHRIDSVTYRLDADDLGVEDGTRDFEKVLPAAAP